METQPQNDFLYGVNLGGWLVLEKWMTPGLFKGTDAVDEYTFMQTPGARDKLRRHQRDFIREEDFKWMRDSGVNAVRIPIGHWIFEGDGPFVSGIGRLDWAVRMATKYDIKVLICLHGAPGSQNGRDHSGKIGPALWYQDAKHRQKSVDVLVKIAERYRNDLAVWGIQLLNEPLPKLANKQLREYYRKAYREVARSGRTGLVVVYSDAFTPRLLSGALWSYTDYPVYMDHHWYHFFIPRWLQPKLPLKLYYWYLKWKKSTLRRLSRGQPIIIGEWNGIIGGEKLNLYQKQEHNLIVGEHLKRQFDTYCVTAGWFYWSYKTEDRGVYHFRSMVEDGVIELPKPK